MCVGVHAWVCLWRRYTPVYGDPGTQHSVDVHCTGPDVNASNLDLNEAKSGNRWSGFLSNSGSFGLLVVEVTATSRPVMNSSDVVLVR